MSVFGGLGGSVGGLGGYGGLMGSTGFVGAPMGQQVMTSQRMVDVHVPQVMTRHHGCFLDLEDRESSKRTQAIKSI